MQKLATDVLKAEKRKCTFWKIATLVTLAVAVMKFVVIVVLF